MSLYCSFMKYQMMIDLKQHGKNKIAPCCHFEENIGLEQFEEKRKFYFKQLMNDVRIEPCKHCWAAEDAGITSIRQSSYNWEPSDGGEGIKRLDVRIHNKCNLACTMCYSGASNLWGKLEGEDTFRMLSSEELDFIREQSSNVTHISFQGGEPFYGSDYDDFLMSLPNLNKMSIDVFTNVISVTESVLNRWIKSVRRLDVNASVDGYGEVYDSIRWPTKWSKFEKKAIMIYNTVDRFRLCYFWVMQAENAHNVFDFIKWRNENTPDSRLVLSTVMGSTELGLYSMTSAEQSKFIENYKLYKDSVTDKYLEIHGNEYNQLAAMYNIIYKLEPDVDLIEKRFNKMEYIKDLRKDYNV